MGDFRSAHSGSSYEQRYGFSRARRVGDRVVVSGTAPIPAAGEPLARSAYYHARRCFEIIVAALEQVGAEPSHVVRTRMYLVDSADADELVEHTMSSSARPSRPPR